MKMIRRFLLVITLFLLSTNVYAQNTGSVGTVSSLPGTCSVGSLTVLTTATTGLYWCDSTNHWSLIAAATVISRVTGSNATTTGQALVDIAGLTAALEANAVYTYEAFLTVSTTAVTTGTKYGVNYSVAGGAVEGQIDCSLTATASMVSERVSALNTANTTACLTTSAQSGMIRMTGIVTTGINAGNFTIKHLKVTSGTSTVFINSFLRVVRIG